MTTTYNNETLDEMLHSGAAVQTNTVSKGVVVTTTATGGNVPALVNGSHVLLTPAQLKALETSGYTAYQFTSAFTHQVGHVTVHFRSGWAYILDNANKTGLLAVGAPMTAL